MRSIIILLFFVSNIFLHAQSNGKITGEVRDSISGQEIAFATVALYNNTEQRPIQVMASNNDGQFMFEHLDTGVYVLKVAMLSYKSVQYSQKLLIDSLHQTQIVPTIKLTPTSEELEEVTITAQRPVWELKSDRIVYNAEADAQTSQNALALLRKVPFVTVDGNKKIQLKGDDNFKIQLNGKSTGLIAHNPSEALQAMSAENVKRIEVITEPSAKDEADGTSAGIINIITHRNLVGYNVHIGANINQLGGYGGNAGIELKRGKIGFSVDGSYSKNKALNSFDFYKATNLTNNPLYLQNKGNGNYVNHFSWSSFELAIDIDTLNTISVYGDNFSSNYNTTNNSTFRFYDQYDTTLTEQERYYNGISSISRYNIGGDYIRKLKKPEQELTLSANNTTNSTVKNNFVNLTEENISPILYKNDNHGINIENTFDINYQEGFRKNKDMFKIGAKAILRNMTNNYEQKNWNDAISTYLTDTLLTDVFKYQQNVWALYGEYRWKWKKLSLKGGIRTENTYINALFESLELPVKQNYWSIFPSISISYKNKPTQNISLNYTKRISRPSMWYLNPQINNTNPQNISSGNPNLKPELMHRLELNYTKFAGGINLNLSLSEKVTTQFIGNFTNIDSVNNTAFTAYYNLGNSYTTGISANISGDINSKISTRVNINISYQSLSSNIANKLLTNSGFAGSSWGSLSYKISKTWSSSLWGYLGYGNIQLQGRNEVNYNYTLSITKTFFKEHLNVSLNAEQFLQKDMVWKSYSKSTDFELRTVNASRIRSISIEIGYNFGKLKESISRKKGISNTDVKQNEGSK